MSIFDVVNFTLGVVNLVLAHKAYEVGDTRSMWINGAIGVFCIWSAAL
jgi:hypothetical protein